MTEKLKGRVAVVAGATRGAGRGIACALGEEGAIVYCTGRSVRGETATAGRCEAIDETAEMVTERGGNGIAVRTDHTNEDEVVALFEQVRADQGRLDVLVNDIWGGDELTEWGKRFWEVDVAPGFTMIERAVHTHIITSRHAAPLMIEQNSGLIVEVTDGAFMGYRSQLFYDLCKIAVIRVAYAMSVELAQAGVAVTSLAVTPGFLRSEAMLDHFGVTERDWHDAVEKDPDFAESETPLYVGRAIVALATDPDVHTRAGGVYSSWGLARDYGFTDADGRQPHWDEHLDKRIVAILGSGAPSADDRMLLSVRLPQLDFDPERAEERARITAFLERHPNDLHDFAKRYTAAWCSQDPSRVADFYAEDGVLTVNGGEPNVGRAALTAFAAGFMTAFPDMVLHFDALEQEGERVHYHWTFVGTNTGDGGTGQSVHFSGYESWLLSDDGLIADSAGNFDEAEYARQLEHGG